MPNKETFRYIYSAKEQKEIKKIRNKYDAPVAQEDKMTQLSPTVGMAIDIVIGVVGIILVSCTYPIYNRVLRKERKKCIRFPFSQFVDHSTNLCYTFKYEHQQ